MGGEGKGGGEKHPPEGNDDVATVFRQRFSTFSLPFCRRCRARFSSHEHGRPAKKPLKRGQHKDVRERNAEAAATGEEGCEGLKKEEYFVSFPFEREGKIGERYIEEHGWPALAFPPRTTLSGDRLIKLFSSFLSYREKGVPLFPAPCSHPIDLTLFSSFLFYLSTSPPLSASSHPFLSHRPPPHPAELIVILLLDFTAAKRVSGFQLQAASFVSRSKGPGTTLNATFSPRRVPSPSSWPAGYLFQRD